jgi:hypothetical protein
MTRIDLTRASQSRTTETRLPTKMSKVSKMLKVSVMGVVAHLPM